jgi:hypothetical protein
VTHLDQYDDQPREHECPTPLERPAKEFDLGGMVFTPAGRWETISDLAGREDYSLRFTVHTDRATWTFWPSDKLPYLGPIYAGGARAVRLYEHSHHIEVNVGLDEGYGRGHVLVTAQQVRGKGWAISDQAGGVAVEQITVESKAKARAEVNRRARAHAKRLGLKVWHNERTWGAR